MVCVFLINLTSKSNDEYFYIEDDKEANFKIGIIELEGLIIEKDIHFPSLMASLIISPQDVKNKLKSIKQFSPQIIIFSVNSPGGTVSASNTLYSIIKDFKKHNDVEIFFHTNELLTSGGYWVASSSDGIFASYGSIIGSIGVKGPDWFYYENPISISSGVFNNRIETKDGIKVYSNKAGLSKDLYNPFRRPNANEIKHLQNMVDQIYSDFVRIISKERKIEIDFITNEIKGLVYTTAKAIDLNLIDDELSLDELVESQVKKRNIENYSLVRVISKKKSLLSNLLINEFNQKDYKINTECLNVRTSIAAILSYESIGC